MAKPVVFISSSSEDLKKTGHRAAAREAALSAGLYPEMQEYFSAKDNRPLNECLTRVAQANVLVVIVAHRLGWIPTDQSGDDPKACKSITWLECEHAESKGIEVLPFLIDDDAQWPAELREDYELIKAVQENRLTPELGAEVQWRVNRLNAFKTWLGNKAIRDTFASPDELGRKIESALHQWKQRHHIADAASAPTACPVTYFEILHQENAYIDIRGLHVASGKPHRFPINELYIPLKTTNLRGDVTSPEELGKAHTRDVEKQASIELHQALDQRRLVILGDPGSGKTTFLRRIVLGLCNSHLAREGVTNAESLGLRERPFPMLLSIAQLADYIDACCGRREFDLTDKASPAWLAHFLGTRQVETKTGLDRAFFESSLKEGPAMLLADGLDETPTRLQRQGVSELMTRAARSFPKCRFVVTSRPPAYSGEAVLPDFAQVSIDPLEDAAIERFLTRWCQALFQETEQQRAKHCAVLLEAVQSRREIRRMARNPVMLTALAVVHWHEKRLPEQRADLYESILTWLSRSRETRVGRAPAEVCLNRLQELALAMQAHAEGRQVQVSRRWAAEQIAPEWPSENETPQRKRIRRVETFLQEEELDSGIVVARGDDIVFWHLTFQEYLAARAIGARSEKEQQDIVWSPEDRPSLYLSEWREVLLLLGGVLHKQGVRKVDGFVSAVLKHVGNASDLTEQARCAGLLGAMVQDLSPVDYKPVDRQYVALFDRVMVIFEKGRSAALEIGTVIEVAEALGRAGDPRFSEVESPNRWVDIPAGEFRMGAQGQDRDKSNYDSEAIDRESPVHRVALDAFRIARYPVTVTEYHRFVKAEGYGNESLWEAGGFGQWQTPEGWEGQLENPNRPVVGVSWFEAAAYAKWTGCRLPTEAEWERAARGAEGRRYPWGDQQANPTLLNYWDSKIHRAAPVGIYPEGATPDGILDMAGNVLEWCQDWYGEKHYAKSLSKNPTGPASGSDRVLRGGSCIDYDGLCRSAFRFYCYDPTERNDGIGFRLVSSSFGLGLPS